MPNRVALLRAEIEAAHPDAVLAWRHETGVVYARPGFLEQKVTTGPLHWRQSDADDWVEIDTDLEARADSTWKHGVKSARFDTVLTDDGRRRFYPRRWITTEYVEFAALQYQRTNGQWRAVPTGIMSRVENRLVGTDASTHRLEVGFTGDGSRTRLILKSADLARPIRWQATLVGLTYTASQFVSSAEGIPVGWLHQPYWIDSAADPLPHPIPWAYAGGYFTLTPNFAGAVYPVEVDPDYAVSASGNDCWATSGFTEWYTDTAEGWFGKGGALQGLYYRLTGIAAANGANCTAATTTQVASTSASGTTCNVLMTLNDADNPSMPADAAAANALTMTTAHGHWSNVAAWTAGTAYTSVDFSDAFDEVFARVGWATGQAVLVCIIDDGSSVNAKRAVAMWDHATYAAPYLSLTIAAGTPATVTPAAAALAASLPGGAGAGNNHLVVTADALRTPTAAAIVTTAPATEQVANATRETGGIANAVAQFFAPQAIAGVQTIRAPPAALIAVTANRAVPAGNALRETGGIANAVAQFFAPQATPAISVNATVTPVAAALVVTAPAPGRTAAALRVLTAAPVLLLAPQATPAISVNATVTPAAAGVILTSDDADGIGGALRVLGAQLVTVSAPQVVAFSGAVTVLLTAAAMVMTAPQANVVLEHIHLCFTLYVRGTEEWTSNEPGFTLYVRGTEGWTSDDGALLAWTSGEGALHPVSVTV